MIILPSLLLYTEACVIAAAYHLTTTQDGRDPLVGIKLSEVI